METLKFLPEFHFYVVAGGVEMVIEPSQLAMWRWEKHYETEDESTPIWRTQTTEVTADMLFRLAWFQLTVDPSVGPVPPFEDWLGTVTRFEGVAPTSEASGDADDQDA